MTNTPRFAPFQLVPEVTKAMLAVETAINATSLEHSLAELVRLRASQINGCAYCVDLHSADALRAGENPRRLATLSVWHETPFFTDREQAALAWTEAVTRVSETHVPDAVWEQIRPHFTPEEIVDLTLLVSTINAWNRFAIAFRKLPS